MGATGFKCYSPLPFGTAQGIHIALDTSIRLGCRPAGRVVKLVYTADLKSAALTERTGSSPVAATKTVDVSPQNQGHRTYCALYSIGMVGIPDLKSAALTERTGSSPVVIGWGEQEHLSFLAVVL